MRLRVRTLVPAATLVALAAAVAACSTILGFEDVTLGDTDGGTGSDGGGDAIANGDSGDAHVTTDGPTTDSPTTDSAPDGACGDTTMDPLNCGRCGHSCLKGMCQSSVCQPYALSTGYLDTRDLAVDATSVYFTNTYDNNIYKVSKFDGTGAVKIADQPDAYVPFAIAIDSSFVYWTNRVSSTGQIRKCPLAGCGTNPSTVLATVDSPSALLILGSRMVWSADHGGLVSSADVSDGGNPFDLFNGSPTASPYQLATDTTYVYATDNVTGIARRIPFDGGATTALADTNQVGLAGIAVGGGNVFFAGGDAPAGVVWRVPTSQFVDGGSPSSYASSLAHPAGVAIDATYVYWVNTGGADANDGSVMACPLAGCQTPITLATGQHYPIRIKLDADAVYWTNNGQSTGRDGSVWKVAKP